MNARLFRFTAGKVGGDHRIPVISGRSTVVLGPAERLTSSIQTCWPFIIAVARRRTRRPRPGLAIDGSGGVKEAATAWARACGRRQDR